MQPKAQGYIIVTKNKNPEGNITFSLVNLFPIKQSFHSIKKRNMFPFMSSLHSRLKDKIHFTPLRPPSQKYLLHNHKATNLWFQH